MCDIKSLFSLKTLWILANITCTVILTVQLSVVFEGYIKPTITRTWEKDVPLQNMDFPLVIKVCVIPGFNHTALQEMGYQNTWDYFLGQSRFNQSVYGWAGHTNQSGTIKSVEKVLKHASDYKVADMFSYIRVYNRDAGHISIALEELKFTRASFPNNCPSLSLSTIPALRGRQIQQLFIGIGDLGNHRIAIWMYGNSLIAGRYIREHNFHSTGDSIQFEKNKERAYVVDINQRIIVEEDPSSTCRDYPNQVYESYQECDDQFMRNILPPELTPIWITDDFERVSTHVVYGNDTARGTPENNR